MRRLLTNVTLGLLVFSLLGAGPMSMTAQASSHREAPSSSVDPQSDATDVYAFVSPDDPATTANESDTVTIIANFIPFQNPAGGPNFYRFDDSVLYTITIDNNADAQPDFRVQFQFRTDVRNPNRFSYLSPAAAPATPGDVRVTTLDDPDLNIRQFYDVTAITGTGAAAVTTVVGTNLPVAPSYVGDRSMGDAATYETNLAIPAIRDIPITNFGIVRVFAGQRDDPFFADTGAIFDLLTLRPFSGFHVISPGTGVGAARDTFSSYNVNTIALQVPISGITANRTRPTDPNDPNAVIGVYASSFRRGSITFAGDRSGGVTIGGDLVQVSRLGNPLVNEVIIPLGFKDRFNASVPADDAQFLRFVERPEPARLIDVLYGPTVDVPQEPRPDIVSTYLTGLAALNAPGGINPISNITPAEYLRLNVAFPATPVPTTFGASSGDRLGAIPDPAFTGYRDPSGFPNGRRVTDDVVDITLRLLAGVLFRGYNIFPNNALGDGINFNDRGFRSNFPFLATPKSGYDPVHRRRAVTGASGFTAPEFTP